MPGAQWAGLGWGQGVRAQLGAYALSSPEIVWLLKAGSSPSGCQMGPGPGGARALETGVGAGGPLGSSLGSDPSPAISPALDLSLLGVEAGLRGATPSPPSSSHGNSGPRGMGASQISAPAGPLLRKSKKGEKGLMSALREAPVSTAVRAGMLLAGWPSTLASGLGPCWGHLLQAPCWAAHG